MNRTRISQTHVNIFHSCYCLHQEFAITSHIRFVYVCKICLWISKGRKNLKANNHFGCMFESPACLMQLKTSGYAFCGKESPLRMKDESKCSCFCFSHWRLIFFLLFFVCIEFFGHHPRVLSSHSMSPLFGWNIRIIKSIWRGSGGNDWFK